MYIDGLPFVRAGGNGDPRYVWTAISVDAVDQFQVQTSGYSAIYEGQGVMNYSVKRGGIQQHGSVYEFFRNTALDTWGFLARLKAGSTAKLLKPVEHSNEYGINLGGPLIPFGCLKDKLFYFTNYNGFRYSQRNADADAVSDRRHSRAGDFSARRRRNLRPIIAGRLHGEQHRRSLPVSVRLRPGYRHRPGRQSTANRRADHVIPSSEFSTVAKNMQSRLPPSGIGTALQNNYTAPNPTGLINWSTTSRIDYVINSRDTITLARGHRPSGQFEFRSVRRPRAATWARFPTTTASPTLPRPRFGSSKRRTSFSPNLVNQVK